MSPLDPTTEEGQLRLASYVWPDQVARLARLRGALNLAAQVPATVHRMPAVDFVRRLQLVPGTTTVLWHSVVWQYLSPAERTAVERALDDLAAGAGRRGRLAHLRAGAVSGGCPAPSASSSSGCGPGRAGRTASSAPPTRTASRPRGSEWQDSGDTSREDRHAVRPLLRGVRGRRRLQALARQDGHGVRRPPVLPADDEPPPAAPRRPLRRVDRIRSQRRRRQLHLLIAARHVGARRVGQGDREPRGRVAQARPSDVPRRHHLRRDDRAGHDGVPVEDRPRRGAGRDARAQPGRRRRVRVPAQGDGAQAPSRGVRRAEQS